MRAVETSREKILPLSTDPELRRRFMVVAEPIPGNFRFGVLLEFLDTLAAETAIAYSRRAHPQARVVTAALDQIVVRHVADVSEDVRCQARINDVGRTSMEVGIRVDQEGGRRHLASCYFTMVARDGDGPDARSVPVPPLDPGHVQESARAERARARRASWRRELETAVEPPTREEFQLLSRVHRAQDEPGFAGVLASDVATETWERTFPEQENKSKVIFGGFIMRRAYELSSICAERIATQRPVLAAVNRINFFTPVRIGDKIHLASRVAFTSGPAVCVETAIERVSRDRSARSLSNSCLFTFANVGPDLAPADVPEIFPTTYGEDSRYLEARRNLRALLVHTTKGWVGSEAMRGRPLP